MKAAVIIPVYNVEKYLGKCIESAMNQSERDIEIILVDDGSTDASPEICDGYSMRDDRIKVIHQENAGLGGARNTGIRAAAADWLFFLDSDDYLDEETIEKALEAGEKHGADMVIFGIRSVDEKGFALASLIDGIEKNRPLSLNEKKDMLISLPAACNKAYKRMLFMESGIAFPAGVWYEDIRTTLKLMLFTEKIVYIPEVLYNYLSREGSITKNINAGRNREIIEAFEDLTGFFKEKGKFEEFHGELEFLTLYHVYIVASVRVIRIDRKHALLDEFADFIKAIFPNYRENKYLHMLTKNEKILFNLLEKKRYRTISLIFKIKG